MGRPKGAENKDKSWRDAVRAAVNELRKDEDSSKKIKSLRLLARKLVTKALEGDVAAIKEVGDRLDGKATQQVTVDKTLTVTHIEHTIVDMPKVIEGEVVEVKDATGDGESDEDTRDNEQALTH
jgi:ribosomal protein L17